MSQIFSPIAGAMYPLLGLGYLKVQNNYQLILALITPLLREFFVRILLKICYKASGNRATRNAAIARGVSINHMDSFLDIFDPLPLYEPFY